MRALPKIELKLIGAKNPYNNEHFKALLRSYPIFPIKNEREHKFAMELLDAVMEYNFTLSEESRVSSVKKDAFSRYIILLASVIETYEKKRYSGDKLGPMDVLKELMAINGLRQSDLTDELGGQSNVSKILTKERDLTATQIRKLAARFKVSPELFV